MEKERHFELLNNIKKELREKNFTEVPFSLSKEELNKAATAFLEFLKLPEELKEKLHSRIREDDRGAQIGYRKKEQEYGDLDNKEYFHYNEYIEEEFKEFLENKEVNKFLKYAKIIYNESKETIRKIIKELDHEYPGIYRNFFPENKKPYFYLRFLKYNSTNKDIFLAKGHYDRGCCTLAIAESSPGLRIGKNDKEIYEVTHRENRVIFFPGKKLHEITSKVFRPAWHDVVQKGTNYNKEVARWAIVFFADAKEMRITEYEEAHTPIYNWEE